MNSRRFPSLAGATLQALIIATFVLVSTGCESTSKLMPTPTLYTLGNVDPFPDVPPAYQNNKVEVLYVTDRALEKDSDGKLQYGYKRSRSVAYGVPTCRSARTSRGTSWSRPAERASAMSSWR